MHKKYQGGGTVKKDSLLIFKGDVIFFNDRQKVCKQKYEPSATKGNFRKIHHKT